MGDAAIPCVIYAAKSTEDVRGSIATQIADCTSAVRDRGGREVVGTFVDEAVSGFKRSRGVGLSGAMARVADLAGDGPAELWVQHSDRLARGDGKTARHVVEIALWALKADITVRPVQDPDTFRDLLYAVVMGQRNHEDSKRKAAAVSAGKRRAAERGEWAGALLDGYRIAVEVGPRGQVNKRMEIDPDRQPLFDLIFKLGLAGKLPYQIADRVNSDGWRTVPVKGDTQAIGFSPNRIRFVLGNPRYAGLATYRQEVVADAQWPPYITRIQHERLIKRRRKRARGPTVNPREPFLLARLAVCGRCGARMITLAGRNRLDGTPTLRYACASRQQQRLCSAPRLDTTMIDALFVANLEQFIDALPDLPSTLGPKADNGRTPESDLATRSSLKRQIRHAFAAGNSERANLLLDQLARRPQPERLASALDQQQVNETPADVLNDFRTWSDNEIDGRPFDSGPETRRLNQILRGWFTRVELHSEPPQVRITVHPRAKADDATTASPPPGTSATGSLGAWHIALRQAGHGRRPRRQWTDAEIGFAMRSWSRENGRPPRCSDWPHLTSEHPCNSTVSTRYHGWKNALKAAGLPTMDADPRGSARTPATPDKR